MARTSRVTDEEVRAAVAAAESMTDALRRLGLRPAGGNHASLRRRIERLGLPTDHFDAAAANRRAGRRRRIPLEAVLVRGSDYKRASLKRQLYESGLKVRRCEACGQGEEWRGRRMALILDHINGVPTDNRLENIQILCPNCAATLDTHCARNATQPRESRSCRRCGESFVPRRSGQQYCSRACGNRGAPGSRRARPWRGRPRPPHMQLLTEIRRTATPRSAAATASRTTRSASGCGPMSAKRGRWPEMRRVPAQRRFCMKKTRSPGRLEE